MKLFEVRYLVGSNFETFLTVGKDEETEHDVCVKVCDKLSESCSCFMSATVREITEVDGFQIAVKEPQAPTRIIIDVCGGLVQGVHTDNRTDQYNVAILNQDTPEFFESEEEQEELEAVNERLQKDIESMRAIW